MAREVSKEGLRTIVIQAMCAAKSIRAQLDRLMQLRRRLQQRSPGDADAAVVQEVAAGLFKVYYRGLEYASRYLASCFQIAVENDACLDEVDSALALIPDEQLYDVLLAQRLPARPTTQAQAFARIGAALYAVKLPEEHHIPRCIELLVGVRPLNVTGKPSPFSGMTGYSDNPVAAAHEYLAKNGFPNPALATEAPQPLPPPLPPASPLKRPAAWTWTKRSATSTALAPSQASPSSTSTSPSSSSPASSTPRRSPKRPTNSYTSLRSDHIRQSNQHTSSPDRGCQAIDVAGSFCI